MVKFTERDLTIVAGLAGAADFYTEGKFSAPVARALKKIFARTAPVAARGAAAFVPRALGTARFVAMRHPYIAAAVITYEVVKNREQIGQLLNEGWQVIQQAGEARQEALMDVPPIPFTDFKIRPSPGKGLPTAIFGKKRRPSAFNKAVKAGMAAVKKSTSYGKKGTISPAKKVFSVVVKLASAKLKKKKAPKSGIRRLIWNAMKGLR